MDDSQHKDPSAYEEPTEGAGDEALALVDEQEEPSESSFERELKQTLNDTEQAILTLRELATSPDQARSWQEARTLVEQFRPVPWFIWRLSNYVFCRPGLPPEIGEGMVFGMRRLMFAVASDPLLGGGQKVNTVRSALKTSSPDVIAAASVIHAICRRLSKKPHERIWKPILDDALLRARIGFHVGGMDEEFGSGRGMLTGFAGRCGLAMLLGLSELEQARKALEMLATGVEIRDVGLTIFQCDPLQISAMTLSACGCGRDAAFGTVSYSLSDRSNVKVGTEQFKWLSAFSITEQLRIGEFEKIDEKFWLALGFYEQESRDKIATESKKAMRRGHAWHWLV